MTLGEKLKQLRISKDYTQEQLCKLLNIERSSYSNYELNKRFPDHHILIKLSDLYHISLDLLLRENYEKHPFLYTSEEEEFLRNFYALDKKTRTIISEYVAFCARRQA